MNRNDGKEIALALCGSITTFSGWILIIVRLDTPGLSFWLLSTFWIFVTAFNLGERFPVSTNLPNDKILGIIGAISYVTCVILSCFGYIYFPLAIVLSPVGVFMRYLVSLLNNPNAQFQVYLGTSLVNFTGTLGLLLMVKYSTGPYTLAVADGFFGCYTTISSVARDVAKIEVAKVWVFVSVALSWGVAALIVSY